LHQVLEAGTLIFLAALHVVVASDGSRTVLLALEVAVDPIEGDLHPACVLKRLEITAKPITLCQHPTVLIIEEDVGLHSRAFDARCFALDNLNAPPDSRSTPHGNLS